MEIETNDFTVLDEGKSYGETWTCRLKAKIRKARDGDVLIVKSGLQRATALALLTQTDKKLSVVKR